MALFFYGASYAFLILSFFTLLKGTVFSISIRRGYLGGIFIFRELFLLVLFGVLLFGVLGVSSFNVVHASELDVHSTGVAIFLSVALLILSISFFSRFVFSRYLMIPNYFRVDYVLPPRHIGTLVRSVSIILILLIFWAHLTGTSHAFIRSVVYSEDLMSVRLSNRYGSSTVGHVMLMLKFSYIFLCLLVSYFGRVSAGKAENVFHMVVVVYAATLPGDKAPLLQVIILALVCFMAKGTFSPKKIFSVGIFSGLFLFLLLYFLVIVQYPGMTLEGFFFYLVDRLGVGQIQGVYEQFSLGLSDWRYILKEVPFSGVFTNPPSFSKDLMLNTLSQNRDASETGVMNSFFIGEAYAIGGFLFVLVSPIIVAFNYCFIAFFVIYFVVKFYMMDLREAQLIGVLFCSSVIMFTGDFNGLLFGKKIFILFFYFFIVFLTFRVIRGLIPFKSG